MMPDSDNPESPTVDPASPSVTCFVIGPIGSELAPIGSEARTRYEDSMQVWEEIILPACKEVGLETPVRADQLARAGEITEQIFRRLRNDDVVIADVTDANPNVMYELGLRHTLDRLTVQIGEFDRLPFDVSVIRTIEFSRSTTAIVKARKRLVDVLQAGLAGEFDAVSATRIWVHNYIDGDDVVVELDRHSSEVTQDDAPGLIDLMAAAEDQMDSVQQSLGDMNDDLAALSAAAEEVTGELAKAESRGTTAKAMLTIMNRWASRWNPIADQLGVHVASYSVGMDAIGAATSALIDLLESDPGQVPTALQWAIPFRSMASQARGAIAGLSGLLEAIESGTGYARALRRPIAKTKTAIDEFSATTGTLDEWDRRLQALGVPVEPTQAVP
jgi:hypothetical protein